MANAKMDPGGLICKALPGIKRNLSVQPTYYVKNMNMEKYVYFVL